MNTRWFLGKPPTWCPGRYWRAGRCELFLRKREDRQLQIWAPRWRFWRPVGEHDQWFKLMAEGWNQSGRGAYWVEVPLPRAWAVVFMVEKV